MLVIQRNINEETYLTLPNGDVITVAILNIFKNSVKIGFSAPPDVAIHRDDIKVKAVSPAKEEV